jgi:hypothetical protein
MVMLRPIQARKITVHALALIFSIGLAFLSGQNPRILLYAQAISLLYRFISIGLLAAICERRTYPSGFIARLSREPLPGERSRPYRDQRRGDLAGIGTYLVVILTIIFMLVVLFQMTGARGFLDAKDLAGELSWAGLIAVIYWIDDLLSKQFVLAPGKSRAINLGYNVAGLNFLLAAIFISAIVILVVHAFTGIFLARWPDYLSVALSWMVFLMLSLVRFVADAFNLVKKRAELP